MVTFYDIVRGLSDLADREALPPDIAELELRYLRRLFLRRQRLRPFLPPLRDCCRMRTDDRDTD